jgi:hypothetical protein
VEEGSQREGVVEHPQKAVEEVVHLLAVVVELPHIVAYTSSGLAVLLLEVHHSLDRSQRLSSHRIRILLDHLVEVEEVVVAMEQHHLPEPRHIRHNYHCLCC